jgi:hypothetical protein
MEVSNAGRRILTYPQFSRCSNGERTGLAIHAYRCGQGDEARFVERLRPDITASTKSEALHPKQIPITNDPSSRPAAVWEIPILSFLRDCLGFRYWLATTKCRKAGRRRVHRISSPDVAEQRNRNGHRYRNGCTLTALFPPNGIHPGSRPADPGRAASKSPSIASTYARASKS